MKTEDIEYNGQIFTCQKIIDFSAMIELLSALAKKQEYLEKKVNFHEERINDKDNRISELKIMLKGSSQSKEEKFPSEKEFARDKKEKEEEDEEEKEELNDSLDKFLDKDNKSEKKEKDEEEKDDNKKDEDNKEKTKEEEENKEKNKDEDNKEIKIEAKTTEKKKENEVNKENEKIQDKKDENNNNTNNDNDEIIKKIIKKLKILEAKVNNLEKLESSETRTTIIGKPAKKGGDNRINALKKQMDEYEEQLNKINKDIAKIKEKVEDLNIYDLFKSDSGDGNIDICKGLVMALENKIFKKFGFYDVKFKKNDGDIFQNQSDIKNINALIDGIKEKENKMSDEMNEIKNNNEQKHIDLNKLIKENK